MIVYWRHYCFFVEVDVDMDDVSFVYPVEGKILAF